MRNKFFAVLLAAAVMLSSAGAAFAAGAKAVPGDVLVIFENPSEAKVSIASLGADGEHGSYVASVASSMSARVAHTYATLSEEGDDVVVLMHSDTKSELELLEELKARPDVKGAALNYIRQAQAVPNDRYYGVYPDENGLMWGMKAISADKVWDAGHTGSNTVYVAVIDSGIDVTHPDLKANIATEYCKRFDANGNEATDYTDVYTSGHGTHVSGIIGAVGNNGEGVVGVGWNTRIIMLRAYNYDESSEVYNFSDAASAAAFDEAVRLKKQGVNIAAVNLSVGGWDDHGAPDKVSNSSDPLWRTIRSVSDAGIVLSVAAGNESQRVGYPAPCDDLAREEYKKGDYVYPASYLNIPNMIVVAAARQDENGNIVRSALGNNEAGSNYGSEYVDIAAPGSHIVSTVPYNYKVVNGDQEIDADEYPNEKVEDGVKNYASWAGTSMAAPHVAGAVALLKAAYPNATAEQIKKALLEGANGNYCKDDKDTPFYDGDTQNTHVADGTSKYGFLDVKAALDKLPDIMKEPDLTPTPTPTPSGGSSSSGCDMGFLGLGGLALLAGALLKRRTR